MRPQVVTLGEAMLRLSAPHGETLQGTGVLDVCIAGAESNVAAALARLGVRVAWISALPDSPLGRRVFDELRAAGVALDFVSLVPDARLGVFFVEHGSAPRPTRVWYDRKGSAFSELAYLDPGAVAGARYAVVSGVTLGLGERSQRLAAAFADAAERHGAALCVDVNYRALLWPPEAAREGIAELLEAANLVVCSERDARVVFGCVHEEAELAAELAERWAPAASIVVITRSDSGSVLLDRQTGGAHVQPAFTTKVVDRFGAGDAFVAGLLWGLLDGRTPADAQRTGAALAALTCSIAGDISRSDAADVSSLLAASDPEQVVR